MPAATVNIPSNVSTTPISTLVTKLTRGFPAKLGTLIAANTAVAFTVPEPSREYNAKVVIQIPSTAGTGPTLEISIDGGATFLPLALTTLTIGTALTGDTACTAMYQVDVSGMGAGALFKFGYTGGSPSTAVWALVG